MKKKVWISIISGIVLILIIVGCIVFTQCYSKKISPYQKGFVTTIIEIETTKENKKDVYYNYHFKIYIEEDKKGNIVDKTYEYEKIVFKPKNDGMAISLQNVPKSFKQAINEHNNYIIGIKCVEYPFNKSNNYVILYYYQD